VPFSAAELATAAPRECAHSVTDMSTPESDASNALRWRQVVEFASRGNVAPPRRVEKSAAEWRAKLTDEQYYVTRSKGTERPFSSELCSLFEPGRYHCICCDTPLFDSTNKFESGTGWPSFTAPLTPNVVAYHFDTSYGTQEIEANCNVCDAHLGHVFPDGPPPSGLRFCINAVSLRKAKSSK
jgi:peptide-methionine (R)-S-oxide reductase